MTQLMTIPDHAEAIAGNPANRDVPGDSTILRAMVLVDCVILKFDEGKLLTLLTKENNAASWSLPSRPMQNDESAHDAAVKLVQQFSHDRKPHLDQVYTFTDPGAFLKLPAIAITYVALLNSINASPDSESSKWFPLPALPEELISTHREKITEAMNVIKRKATYDPVCFDLLPEKFTLPQLRKLFEEIFNEQFDQRNFNKKFRLLGVLIKLNEKETMHSKKGAFYYMFDRRKYYQMERPGLRFAHLLY